MSSMHLFLLLRIEHFYYVVVMNIIISLLICFFVRCRLTVGYRIVTTDYGALKHEHRPSVFGFLRAIP